MIHYSSLLCEPGLDPSESLRYGTRATELWDEERALCLCSGCRLYMWSISHGHCPTPFLEASISQTFWIKSTASTDDNVFLCPNLSIPKGQHIFLPLKLRVTTTILSSCFIEHRQQRSRAHWQCSFLFQCASTLVWIFFISALRRNHSPLMK